jgi:hypothetical protein
MSTPMRSDSEDTSREAAQVQAALVRAAPVGRRLHLAFDLSATVIGLARRAIARAMPEASTRARDLRFVRLHYGDALANELEGDLARRDPPDLG